VLEHADRILADVAKSLQHRRVVVSEGRKRLGGQIGANRAARGIHPGESLRAASELFGTVLTEIVGVLPPSERDSLGLAFGALNNSIMIDIRDAARTYSGFLLSEVHRAHVEERRHLARELHDRVGSRISFTHLLLELAEMYRENAPEEADRRLASAQEQLIAVMSDIRGVTSGLRLAVPGDKLGKSLQKFLLTASVGEQKTQVTVNGDESWVPGPVLDEVFLVIREALLNALRHGQAQVISVSVDIAPHELRVAVDDDGVGFEVGAPRDRISSGIPSMRERIALLGGNMLISSSAGQGTRVELFVPLQGDSDARAV
jgi:signal transduction histidine kinase